MADKLVEVGTTTQGSEGTRGGQRVFGYFSGGGRFHHQIGPSKGGKRVSPKNVQYQPFFEGPSRVRAKVFQTLDKALGPRLDADEA